MQILALDFDGVICDSAQEVFLVGLRTFRDLFPDSALVARFLVGNPSDRELDDLFSAFSDVLPLGNRAEDFGVALRAIDNNVEIADQQDYDRYYASLEPEWLRSFHQRFYEQRAALRDRDRDAWIRLHVAYSGFTDQLAEFARFARANKAYWIIPLVLFLALAAFLIVGGQSAAPLLYTLF